MSQKLLLWSDPHFSSASEEQNELKTQIQNNFSNFSQCGSDGIDAVTEHLNQVWRCLTSPEQKEIDVPSAPWLSSFILHVAVGVWGFWGFCTFGSQKTLTSCVAEKTFACPSFLQGFGRYEGILRNSQEVLAGGYWVRLGAIDLDEFDNLVEGFRHH